MAEPITLGKLVDANIDADTLGEFANEDKTVVSRKGLEYPSAAMASRLTVENGLLGATPFSTYAAMTASALADGDYAVVTNDNDDKNGFYQIQLGVWVRLKWNPEVSLQKNIEQLISQTTITEDYVAAFADKNGNMAVGIKPDGEVHAPRLLQGSTLATQDTVPGYVSVIADKLGNIAFGVKTNGSVHIPNLDTDTNTTQDRKSVVTAATSDTILFIGDSYTASHYTLKDKAYISNVSNFIDYRVRNIAISGDESLDINARIVKDIAFFDGLKPHEVNAKYAFIASYTNDITFRNINLAYYKQNLSRLVESVKSLGIEPILGTEFTADAIGISIVKAVAREQGIRFIDCSELNNEIGNLKKGMFHQGHPGTRTNGVFWLPIIKAVAKLPRPANSIKIYRKRATFIATTTKDLLYKDRVDRYKRFKEISVSHYRLADANAQYYDELDGSNVRVWSQNPDEYLKLGGSGVNFDDYGLIEITLDGTAQTIDELSININTDAKIYVRNYLDSASSFAGYKNGTTTVTPDYVEHWDSPRGAWLELGSLLSITKSQLKGLMLGDKMQILLYKSGGFTLNDISLNYTGGGKVDKYIERQAIKTGSEILTSNTFDSLANWTTTGTPSTLIPIDNYNSPRLPTDRTQPVNKVITVSNSATVGRTVTLPKLGARYRLTVWARYFPKAFIDNSFYALDAEQVIDRSAGNTFPANSQITLETADIRKLVLRYGFDNNLTQTNSFTVSDFACLSWRGIEFDIYVPESPLGKTDFTFNLSCDDGEVQIAKINLTEII